MRKIDAITIGFGVFAAGGIIYFLLQVVGIDSQQAGIWSQAVLVGGVILWLLTYLFRAGTKNMTYHQQREEYDKAFLEKRLEELTPEELTQLQAEIEAENQKKSEV